MNNKILPRGLVVKDLVTDLSDAVGISAARPIDLLTDYLDL